MTRPNWDNFMKQVRGMYVSCTCGHTLETTEAIRAHWQLGHFDNEEQERNVTYDAYDIVKFVGTYVQAELGGKVSFSNNAMFDDNSITLAWEKYDVLHNETLQFNYKIAFRELESAMDPNALGRTIVERYRETKIAPKALPSSLDEKEGQPVKQHWLYVHELRAMLNKLESNDCLLPNSDGDLYVSRGDNPVIATIDFQENQIKWRKDK